LLESSKTNFAALLPSPLWSKTIEGWLNEDIPSFDYGKKGECF
jgi:hypothetical protein